MTATKNIHVRIREETRTKLDAIRTNKRWSIVQTIDAIADDFIERERISLPRGDASRARRRPKATAST